MCQNNENWLAVDEVIAITIRLTFWLILCNACQILVNKVASRVYTVALLFGKSRGLTVCQRFYCRCKK